MPKNPRHVLDPSVFFCTNGTPRWAQKATKQLMAAAQSFELESPTQKKLPIYFGPGKLSLVTIHNKMSHNWQIMDG